MADTNSHNNKALKINLDDTVFGTFAEIGGGQETSAMFFRVGGASGTVAKTICAYHKSFSDSLYNQGNKSGRYVSEGRLRKMLEKEYAELDLHLAKQDESSQRIFAFANTVETINFRKDNQGHGWVGIRFRLESSGNINDVILHVNLHEKESVQQQITLGILGVNLIYGVYHYASQPEVLLKSLMDNIPADSLEINMIRMEGPDFQHVDNRILSVQLVKNGMTPLAIFDRNGNTQQPGDMLYKKHVLLLRGSFRPITYAGFDMLKTGYSLMKKELQTDKNNSLVFCEMTLDNLLEKGSFNERDFLDRVDLLNGMGQNVMISRFREFYRLTDYLSNIKISNLRLIIGAETLLKLTEKKYYKDLKGGILEAFGRLFLNNVKMYVYPSIIEEKNLLLTSENIPVRVSEKNLYKYILSNGQIMDITDYKMKFLYCSSHKVLDLLIKNDNNWETMVPVYISEHIRKNNLFGCNDCK